MYDYLMLQNTNIKNKDMCKKRMPVDVSENYSMSFI